MQSSKPFFVEPLLHGTVHQQTHRSRQCFTPISLLAGLFFVLFWNSIPFMSQDGFKLMTNKVVFNMALKYMQTARARPAMQARQAQQPMQEVTNPQSGRASRHHPKPWQLIQPAKAWQPMQSVKAAKHVELESEVNGLATNQAVSESGIGVEVTRPPDAPIPTTHIGILMRWVAGSLGFGFIRPEDGSEELYVPARIQATHTFKPGKMGAKYSNWGAVMHVSSDGQARAKGISKGDQIVKIGDQNFSKAAVANVEKSGADYNITFKVLNCHFGKDGVQVGNKVTYVQRRNLENGNYYATSVCLAPGGGSDHRAEVSGAPLDQPIPEGGTGILMRWGPQKEFGFIKPESGDEEELFVLGRNFVDGKDSVQEGNKVTYVPQWSVRHQKYQAADVRVAPGGEGDHRAELSRPPSEHYTPAGGTGVLMTWDADKGFGFIRHEGTGQSIFAHITRGFVDGVAMQEGNRVTYATQWNHSTRKYEATEVRLAPGGEGDHRAEVFGPPPDQPIPEGGTGILMRWGSQKGFGFIRPERGGNDIFVRWNSLLDGNASVQEGNKVTYVPRWDALHGKYQAADVRLAPGGEGDHRAEVSAPPPDEPSPAGGLGVLMKMVSDKAHFKLDFGFIKPENGGEELFVHEKSFADGKDSVREGNKVTYVPRWNVRHEKFEAADVRVAPGGEGDHRAEVFGPHPDLPIPEGGTGLLMRWVSQKGFGFIKPENEAEDELFVHEANFVDGKDSVREGNKVTYVARWDAQKQRYEAADVRLAPGGEGDHRADLSGPPSDEPSPRDTTGVLMRMVPDKYFGFIKPENDSEEDLFVHMRHFAAGKKSVREGNKVTYVPRWNVRSQKYEARAVRVAPGGDGDHRAEMRGGLGQGRGRGPSPDGKAIGTGVLMTVFDKGFGFIRPEGSDGNENLFVNFADGDGGVQAGNKVTYAVRWNHNHRKYVAAEVSLAPGGEGDHRAEASGSPLPEFGTAVLMRYRPDRGFGFIRPEQSSEDLFVHARNFADGVMLDSMQEGNKVTYVSKWNDRSQQFEATEVRLAPDGKGDYRQKVKNPRLPLQSPTESGTGVITQWDSTAGFGVISPDGDDEDLFCHARDLADGEGSVQEGDRVTFDRSTWRDHKGRHLALEVRLAVGGEGDHRADRSSENDEYDYYYKDSMAAKAT